MQRYRICPEKGKVMHLKIVGEKNPALLGLVESKGSPDSIRVCIGGLPSGDFGVQYLRQVGGNRSVVAVKFNRFKDAGEINALAELAGVSIDNPAMAERYARLNAGYVLSPSALTEEAVTTLAGIIKEGAAEFAGLKPLVAGHSYGTYAIVAGLDKLSEIGVLAQVAKRSGRVALFAPKLFHPEIHHEKWETEKKSAEFIAFVRTTQLYAGVTAGWCVAASQAMSWIWDAGNGRTAVKLPDIPSDLRLNVVISDADEYLGIASKQELVATLRESGVDARLIVLMTGAGARRRETEGLLALPVEKKLVELGKEMHPGLELHDLYPFFALKLGVLDSI